ncbi:hypothetical protein Tco_1357942, partial [Tanacetum coccineum]
MELNIEEAFRAKEHAEKLLLVNDYTGAEQYAIKAQALCPQLEGVSHMVATFDIYAAAQTKINAVSGLFHSANSCAVVVPVSKSAIFRVLLHFLCCCILCAAALRDNKWFILYVINTCARMRQLDLMGLNPCRDSPYVMGFPVGSIVWALEVYIGVAMAHSSWVQDRRHFTVIATVKKNSSPTIEKASINHQRADTDEELREFTSEYYIPAALHPEVPAADASIAEFPVGKVGMICWFLGTSTEEESSGASPTLAAKEVTETPLP